VKKQNIRPDSCHIPIIALLALFLANGRTDRVHESCGTFTVFRFIGYFGMYGKDINEDRNVLLPQLQQGETIFRLETSDKRGTYEACADRGRVQIRQVRHVLRIMIRRRIETTGRWSNRQIRPHLRPSRTEGN
jgi:hypothetical protein